MPIPSGCVTWDCSRVFNWRCKAVALSEQKVTLAGLSQPATSSVFAGSETQVSETHFPVTGWSLPHTNPTPKAQYETRVPFFSFTKGDEPDTGTHLPSTVIPKSKSFKRPNDRSGCMVNLGPQVSWKYICGQSIRVERLLRSLFSVVALWFVRHLIPQTPNS